MLQPMIFIHIPKTAGTSFRMGASEFFKTKNILEDYGNNVQRTSRLVQNLYDKKIDIVEFRKQFDYHQFQFLTGHIEASKYLDYFDKKLFVTFLRNPIQRLVSEYNHHIRHHGMKIDFQEFYRKPMNQNLQYRVLGGFEALDWMNIGITEQYDESLKRINDFFGTSIKSKQINLGKKKIDETYSFPDEIYNELCELNQLDIELYNKALNQFESYQQKIHSESLNYKGNIGKVTKDSISGWAVLLEVEKYAEVDVYVNKNLVKTVAANLYRKDIQDKNIKRSGMAGFTIPLESLGVISKTDSIEIKFHNTDLLLNNNPVVLSY